MQQSVIGWAAIYVAIAVALFGLAVVLVALRRRVLQRDGGFDLCLRLHPGRWGGGWVFGVGRYDGDQIAWYRTFGVSLRPQLCLVRRELTVVNRRRITGWAVAVKISPGFALARDDRMSFSSWR